MKFYNVTNDYINFLKKYDSKVPDNKQEQRPYVGIVLEVNGMKYYAPFASPKPKHKHMKNSKDFRKINRGIYGAINFNNMIPIIEEALILIDIDALTDEKYKRLLQNQYQYIRADKEQILKTAHNLHTLVFTKDSSLNSNDLHIKQRCCNFPILESVVNQYQTESTL